MKDLRETMAQVIRESVDGKVKSEAGPSHELMAVIESIGLVKREVGKMKQALARANAKNPKDGGFDLKSAVKKANDISNSIEELYEEFQ